MIIFYRPKTAIRAQKAKTKILQEKALYYQSKDSKKWRTKITSWINTSRGHLTQKLHSNCTNAGTLSTAQNSIMEVDAMMQIMNSLKKDQLSEDEAVDMEAEANVVVIVAVQMGDSDRKTIILRSLKRKMIRTSIVPTAQRLATTSTIVGRR